MPFENKYDKPFENPYDKAVLEAATARVLERLFTNPSDRSVFRVVSGEFSISEQSLRTAVAVASPESGARARRKRRPRFSPVVIRQAQREPEQRSADPVESASLPTETTVTDDASELESESTTEAETDLEHDLETDLEADLEAEIARLRHDNESLKAAMRVLLGE